MTELNHSPPLFTYTHSNCKDIWLSYYSRLQTYASRLLIYTMVNNIDNFCYGNKSILYNDSLPYYLEFIRCLESIEEDYFIYMQEDFILYDYVNIEEINRCLSFLKNSDLSFARLLKCGHVTNKKVENKLYLISTSSAGHYSENCFSMQPTIWKKKDFISLYNTCKSHKFGEHWGYTEAMNSLKLNGVYYYDNEKPRGGHFDSSIFPYIATAIIKGKWNFTQYQKELQDIFYEFKIDKSTRGYI